MFYSWRKFQRKGYFQHYGSFRRSALPTFFGGPVLQERLPYLLKNQKSLLGEKYAALRQLLGDSGCPNDEPEAVMSGDVVVLPSIYIGSERYMNQKMHDIVATSNKMGHPDLFRNMTFNSNGPEIRRSLFPGQSPQGRPDFCARVFHLNLKALMEVFIQGKCFRTLCPTCRSSCLHLHGKRRAHAH